MIKRLLAILAVLALLSSCACASAEMNWEDAFGLNEFDDGYEGTWIQVQEPGFEFCLPAGWKKTTAPSDAVFAATNDTGGASLCIRLAAQGVEDLNAWGKANLKDFQTDEANYYDVLIAERDSDVTVYFVLSDGSVLSFDFTRTNQSALPRSFALQIVGSVCELWDDEDIPMMDDDEDFDFGEAFEADVG